MCRKIYIERKYDLLHQHGASCGGQNASMHSGPYEIYIGGQQVFIKLLQNLNHSKSGFQVYCNVSNSCT